MDSLSIDSLRFPDLSGGGSNYNFPSFGGGSDSMFSDLGSFKSVFDQLGAALSGYQQQGAANRLGISGSPKQEGESTVKGPDGREYVMRQGRMVPATAAKPGGASPITSGPTIQGAMAGGDFYKRFLPIAQQVEAETGIPALVSVAIAANETGLGQAAQGGQTWNSYHGIRGTGSAGQTPGGFRAYSSPEESFRDFAKLMQTSPIYQAAVQNYQKTQDPNQFIADIANAGYASSAIIEGNGRTEAQNWIGQVQRAVQNARASQAAPAGGGTIQGVSQFDLGLPRAIAEAFCSQAAVIAFARYNGRDPNVMEVLNLSKEEGWTQGAGQAGPQAHINLLRRVGVPAYMAAPDPAKIAQEVMAGRPVVIDTPGHYYQVTGYNQATGTFTFGDAVGAKAGNVGTTIDGISRFGFGAPRTAIFVGQ